MNPQSPRPLLPRLCRRERGTGKARRVEQQEPRLGPGDHSPGRHGRRAFAQEAPPARLEGALLCRGRLGVRPGPPPSCTHCTPGRGRPWGKPPSHPRVREAWAEGADPLPWAGGSSLNPRVTLQPASPKKSQNSPEGLLPYQRAPFS